MPKATQKTKPGEASGMDRFRHNAQKAGAPKSAIEWWASK